MEEKKSVSLPENAYRELKAGEEYQPVMPAQNPPAEATPYSVTMGVIMAIIFSAASAFLGLKVGQVFEAAIPIAILAAGIGCIILAIGIIISWAMISLAVKVIPGIIRWMVKVLGTPFRRAGVK